MDRLKSIALRRRKSGLRCVFQRRNALAAICLVTCFVLSFSCRGAIAAETIRLAVQKNGTFAWELAIIKDRGLDREENLNLEITELASTDAEKIAVLGGAADIILSDWLWVSRQRSEGKGLTFYPYSSAVGALMVAANSPIKTLGDLAGKKLAVAGGPLDKSWLLLQAYALRKGIDLAASANIVYGTPALLAEKATQREADATLNFWNFCAKLQARGFSPLLSMGEVEKSLGATAPVAMIGYVFDESYAAKHRDALRRFFAITQKAKDILATSDASWQRLAPQIGVTDAAALAIFRKAYIAGIPHRPIEEEAEDARKLYRVIVETGGAKLVGAAPELANGTFYTDIGVN